MDSKTLPQITLDYLANGAPEGQRNEQLFAAACQLRDAGYSASEAELTLLDRARRDGLSESEARTTIRSAFNGTQRKPIRHVFGKVWRPPAPEPKPPESARVKTRRYDDFTPAFDWKLPPTIPDGTRKLLKAAFKPGETILLEQGRDTEDGEKPEGSGIPLTYEKWMQKLDEVSGDVNQKLRTSAQNGIYVCINPVRERRTNADVTAFRHVLVESDKLSLEQQLWLIQKSNLPCTAVVYSGGSSIHAWVRVDAKDAKEYEERAKIVFEHFHGYEFDPQNKNPSRLCRLAGCERKGKRQELLFLNIGAKDFLTWQADLALDNLAAEITPKQLADFKPSEDPNCVLGSRWLCKGGSCLFVGQSGVGKSSIAMQLAILWALARAAFGVRPKRALKSLFIQAENDMGDLAEMFQGVCADMGITPDSDAMRQLERNIIFCTDTVHTGKKFAEVAAALIRKHKPDLVWGDPLLSYIGDDVSSQRVCSEFLRHYINPIGLETGVVWMFLHHTGKPPQDPRARSGWTQTDYSYLGIGSSELVNWARAVVVLTRLDEATFAIQFAKRGKRAGATDTAGTPTTTVYARHAEKGICWIQCDEPPKPEKPQRQRKAEKPSSHVTERRLAVYRSCDGKTRAEAGQIIAKALNISEGAVDNDWRRLHGRFLEVFGRGKNSVVKFRSPEESQPADDSSLTHAHE